jgi:hypothetical protein
MRIAIVVGVNADYRITRRSIPRAHFYLGQVYYLLKLIGGSHEIIVYSRQGGLIGSDAPDKDTPLYYFSNRYKVSQIRPLKEAPSFKDEFDLAILAFYASTTALEELNYLLNKCRVVCYLESDSEVFRPVEMNYLIPRILYDTSWESIKKKIIVFATLFDPRFYKLVNEITDIPFHYLPTVPLPGIPYYNEPKENKCVHIRVLEEGCLAEIAKKISVPIEEQSKSVASPVMLPLSHLIKRISTGMYLMPGGSGNPPPNRIGTRITSKPWEAYLANSVFLVPYFDINVLKEMLPDYPTDLAIPVYMSRETMKKWIDSFKNFSISDSEYRDLIKYQAKYNLYSDETVQSHFAFAAEKLLERLG